MITTSFARSYDFISAFDDAPAPLGWASGGVPEQDMAAEPEEMAPRTNRSNALSSTFDAEARRHNGASEDGGLGEVILDSLFSIAFPGLAAVFSPLGTLDAIDLYDQTRSAFRRSAQPALPRYAQSKGKGKPAPATRRAAANTRQNNAPGMTRHPAPAMAMG